MTKKVITDEGTLVALLECGSPVHSSRQRITAENLLWALRYDSDWAHKFRTFWLPNGFYSTEVE